MELKLYRNNSQDNYVNKSILLKKTIDIVFKNSDSIDNPKIVLSLENVDEETDYCYIPSLKRYYFIKDKKFINNNYVECSLFTDTLMSFKSIFTGLKELESNEGANLETHRINSDVTLENDVSYILLTVGK